MKVYRFMNAQYGLRAIVDRRLKISTVLDLNDPFEMLSISTWDRGFRKEILASRREISERYGILCFSKSYRNPVMWSHYADRHRGLCLGFEIPNDHLTVVRYEPNRIAYHKKTATLAGTTEQRLRELLSVKYSGWSYEEEARIILPLPPKDAETGLHFISFSDRMVLTTVAMGLACALNHREVLSAIDSVSVECFRARAGFKVFDIVENRRQSSRRGTM